MPRKESLREERDRLQRQQAGLADQVMDLQRRLDNQRFDGFSREELVWIILGLAWARTTCAERDDPVLIELFKSTADSLKSRRDSISGKSPTVESMDQDREVEAMQVEQEAIDYPQGYTEDNYE